MDINLLGPLSIALLLLIFFLFIRYKFNQGDPSTPPPTPRITTPRITTPRITTPRITTPTPTITTPRITTPTLTTPRITTPTPTTPTPTPRQPRTCPTSDHESDIYELIVNDPLLSDLNPSEITDEQAKDYILRVSNSEDNLNISVLNESGDLIPLTRDYIDIHEIYNFLDELKINFKFICSSSNQCCLNE